MGFHRERFGSSQFSWLRLVPLLTAFAFFGCNCDSDPVDEDAGTDATMDSSMDATMDAADGSDAGDVPVLVTCATDNGGCDDLTSCTDTTGTVVCGGCPSGYTGTGSTGCVDIDECATDNGGCSALVTCDDTDGGFTCGDCPGGYLDDGAGGCVDIDECDTDNGGCDDTCTDSDGGFTCSCDEGYVLNVDGLTCDDIDECEAETDDCAQLCNDVDGSFECACNMGYELNGDGFTCDDIDECEAETDNCAQLCSDQDGGFTCACNAGYELNGNGFACDDINECLDGMNGGCGSAVEHTCNNVIGGPRTCGCAAGYQDLDANGVCARPVSCRQHLVINPLATSGTYLIDPDGAGGVPELTVYCDMVNDGGGWTLIAKVAAGNYTALSVQAYMDLIANPNAHVNAPLLLSGTGPTAGQMAFYDRPTTNAMYNAAGGRVVRVDMIGNSANAAAIGTYFQQKVNPPANWDFWNAIRDSRMWSDDYALDGYRVVGFGTEFVLAGTSAGFDATTNTVTHQGDDGFGWWSGDALTPTGGGTVNVSRHFGLLNDGYLDRGNLWLLTSDRNDNRFRNDSGSNQLSLIWLR